MARAENCSSETSPEVYASTIQVICPADNATALRFAVIISTALYMAQSYRFSSPNATGSNSPSVSGPCWVAIDNDIGACSESSWRQRPHGVMYSRAAFRHTRWDSSAPALRRQDEMSEHSAHSVSP